MITPKQARELWENSSQELWEAKEAQPKMGGFEYNIVAKEPPHRLHSHLSTYSTHDDGSLMAAAPEMAETIMAVGGALMDIKGLLTLAKANEQDFAEHALLEAIALLQDALGIPEEHR